MSEWVLGFCFDVSYKYVLLVLKNRPSYLEGKLNGIGGKIEPDETPYQAMIRETKEEAGLDILNWEQFARFTVKRGVIYCFAAMDLNIWKYQSMTDEKLRIERLDCMIGKPLPNLNWLLPMAVNFLNKADECIYFHINEIIWQGFDNKISNF
jgi:8-oxo-dGTP diphosphatase